MRRSLHFVVLALLLAGCGERGERIKETGASLEGTIIYGKEKVPGALVIVQGKEGGATATADDNGHFQVNNVPLGEVQIAVNTEAGRGMMKSRMMAGQPVPRMIDVPAKYHDPSHSGITTTIEKGSNTYDISISK